MHGHRWQRDDLVRGRCVTVRCVPRHRRAAGRCRVCCGVLRRSRHGSDASTSSGSSASRGSALQTSQAASDNDVPACTFAEVRGGRLSTGVSACERRAATRRAGRRSACSRGVAARRGLVDEQADEVIARRSTGRRLLVEDDRGAPPGRRSSSPIAWRLGVGAPSGSHTGASPDGRPVGEGSGGGGVRSAMPWMIMRRSTPGTGLRPPSGAVVVVGARPDGALACRP